MIVVVQCSANTVFAADCNSNGVDDTTDISGSTSFDLNSNGIPDECDLQLESIFPGAVDPAANPGDPTVAVGFEHVVSTVNRRIRISEKDGSILASNFLNDDGSPGFFEKLGAKDQVVNPRTVYDQYTDRFIVASLEIGLPPEDFPIYLAVSKTGDPTDLSSNGWHKYRMPGSIVQDGEVLSADFPGLGVDKRAIYITYFFEREGTDDAVASRIRVIDKAAILSGVKNLIEGKHYHDFFLPDRYVIQPAHTFGDAPAEYFVTSKCARSSVHCTTDGFEIFAITGAPGNPVLTSTTITTPEYSAPAPSGFTSPRKSGVPEGPDPPGRDIDAGDWAPYNAVWRDGKLYTAHTIDSDGDLDDPVSRAVRWYEFDLGDWPVGSSTPSLSQTGQIDADSTGVNTISTFFPAIAPNRCGQTAMVMAASSIDLFASIMVTGRDSSDPDDTMLFPQFMHVGTTGLGPVFLWGDYFMVTPDPNYGGTFWAIGQFTVSTGNVATKIGKFTIGSDTDANGIPDACQDCNNNGVDDALDVSAGTSLDCNVNGFPDDCETAELMGDCNTNGVPDECEILAYDCDSNGIDDSCAYDCNNNGYPDACDIAAGTSTDCNNDGAADDCSGDCNTNGSWDDCDIFAGTSSDCNANHIPDECEDECNGNDIPDECELDAGTALDCNTNGVPDDCDIGGATSVDCNSNGTPDECEVDCNTNGIPDDCDIAEGTSQDCGTNGIPDECGADCNTNSIFDECEIEAGTSEDCNTNSVPDECDLAEGGLAVDCDMDGELDECSVLRGASPDCNTNGIPDQCDIATDPDIDCNTNGIVDLCDIAAGTSPDVDTNGRPDDCPCRDTDVDCNGTTGALDLAKIQAPLNWGKDCNSAADPRADANRDGTVGALDLAKVQAPLNWGASTGPCECVPDDCTWVESMMAGGGETAMFLESGGQTSQSLFSQSMASSCSFAPGDLAIEIQPVGGGSAVTFLSPDTTYELHCDAETEHVTTYVLEVVAQTSAQGLAAIAAPSSGDWSDTERFAFTDVLSTYGELITAPGFESGYYRTDWATDTYFPGEQSAAPTGHLCNITTQSAGPFTLVVYLMDEDAESCQYVLMQTALTLSVSGE